MPGSTTPDRFKRAAEAVSKQISGHKAMVAQFKDEIAASSDVQHQVRPFLFSPAYAKQGHQAIWEASDRPRKVF